MTLESVWEVLENGKWKSKQALKEASGVDDTTLGLIVSFLDRWNFVDIRRSPELLIRRKRGVVSPVKTFDLLSVISAGQSIPITRRRLAERVACHVCNGRALNLVGVNEVECARCHEKQWYAIETGETIINHQNTQPPVRLGLLKNEKACRHSNDKSHDEHCGNLRIGACHSLALRLLDIAE